ncbi:hypothetical protein M011DRAFT_225949 [Sporormia fimetaria CBS 119925]|uniref:Uncharacterized protein n=1 Tax=Sporormia fimetaria CBS 119925 TaxID=1340428 RepID=A0A6A6V1T9_9PLEO|nr:hypothetical protein M011DRAFT_225949 [Sporormia fimetaria CBS 119925]
MKFNLSTLLLLSAPFLCAAAPVAESAASNALDARQDRCVVNNAHIDTWHESGLQRRRTAFSSHLTDTGAYCNIFHTHAVGNYGSNIQCWNDANMGWVVDSSWMLGAGGDAQYFMTLESSREQWQTSTGCATG